MLVAFAVLVFSDTKSRVINLLLTEFARAVLGEYRPSVFLVRTSPKRLGPYCQDLGPIFSQYGPRTRSIRYMYAAAMLVFMAATPTNGAYSYTHVYSIKHTCNIHTLRFKTQTHVNHSRPRPLGRQTKGTWGRD